MTYTQTNVKRSHRTRPIFFEENYCESRKGAVGKKNRMKERKRNSVAVKIILNKS